jgi:hypothetical protein
MNQYVLNIRNDIETRQIRQSQSSQVRQTHSSIVSREQEQMQQILDLENVENCLIFAPTQVGKTQATITFMVECLKQHNLIIYSTDNKSDQMDQCFSRVRSEIEILLDHMNVSVLAMPLMSENKFKSQLTTNLVGNIPTIIVLMDNNSQVSKLKERLIILNEENVNIPPTTIFHDEGDVITKCMELQSPRNGQAKSHKEWISICNFFPRNNIPMKRVFVTATPENVVFMYQIRHIISLSIPSSYQGYKQFNYVPLQNEEIPRIIRNEIDRRRNDRENGIILYNTERITEAEEKDNVDFGQDITMYSIYRYASDVVISTYNGHGITTFIPLVFRSKFKHCIQKYNENLKKKDTIKLTEINNNVHMEHQFILKNCPIGWFYQFCKDSNVDVVITIGCDLMNRGISYCSVKKELNSLTATTMIYRPSPSRHGVGLVQTIGRLSGTARPDLKRTLYAPTDIIEKYQIMCENQEDFIPQLQEELENNEETDSKKFFQSFELKRVLKGLVDRPKLKLKFKYRKPENVVQQNGSIDGVNLEKLRKICNGNLIVSKMVRYLMNQNEPINFQQFKEGIEYEQNDKKLISQLDNGKAIGTRHGMLWTCRNNYQEIIMNPNIRQYISDNNL